MPRNTTKTGVESNAKPARPTKAEPSRATQAGTEPARDGDAAKPAPTDHAGKTGTELARDEQRDGGPRYGGEDWKVAAERGDLRFGHARNDDADLAELAPAAVNNDDASPSAADPELDTDDSDDSLDSEDTGEIESGGERAGMGRGEAPRKPKSREK